MADPISVFPIFTRNQVFPPTTNVINAVGDIDIVPESTKEVEVNPAVVVDVTVSGGTNL